MKLRQLTACKGYGAYGSSKVHNFASDTRGPGCLQENLGLTVDVEALSYQRWCLTLRKVHVYLPFW